ncbi:hypothetical protein [Peptostreptococcus porci]|uniref:hypothetical protein n=1 Tax=Peptostreptococcus porci TaxID=2652282 RepID=UPI002A7479B9|nr:hypothetical protein [Peptostreptococcus porci]MDY2793641.1 hypothetical protein [Peptostreptococcus porci]
MKKYCTQNCVEKKHIDLFTAALIGASASTMISPDSYTKTFVTLVLVALSLIACFANDRLKNTTKSVFYKNIGIVYAAIFGVIFSQFFVDNVSIKYIVLIFCIILYFVLYKKSKDLN